VSCPHCGEPTGNAADTALTAEETIAAVELARIKSDTYIAPPTLTGRHYGGHGYEPELALIGGVAVAALAVDAVVKSVVEAVVEQRGARPELPQAIARERPQPLVPVSSGEAYVRLASPRPNAYGER
jgi:hypothetical protein